MCGLVGQIDPSDLNYPSIAVGDLAGKQTVTRTVTNTTNQASVYVPKVEAPAGLLGEGHPVRPHGAARRSATYTVEITRTTAALGLVGVRLADLGRPARAQRAQPARGAGRAAIAATAEVTTSAPSGSVRRDRSGRATTGR